MWATWDPTASLHHGHTAITSTAATESKRERREIWGREWETRKRHTHTQLYKEVIVHVHLGMDPRDRNADRHGQREGFACSLCSA